MIIYGSRPVHIKTVECNHITCQNCDTKGPILLSIFRKHAHVFWIPLFPIGKTGGSECMNCKNVLEPKEMPQDLRQEYDLLKADARGPIWQFSGLLLILVVIIWANFQSAADTKEEREYLANPQIGDVYQTKSESNNYSTMIITDIDADTIYMCFNDYETNKVTGIYKIDIPENYPDSSFGMLHADIVALYDEDKIIDIKRHSTP